VPKCDALKRKKQTKTILLPDITLSILQNIPEENVTAIMFNNAAVDTAVFIESNLTRNSL